MRSASLPFAVVLVIFVSAVAPTIPHVMADSATPRYTVEGVVLTDQGEPVRNATVSGYVSNGSYGANDQATTDEKGAFSLLLPAGEGSLSVYSPDSRGSDGKPIKVEGNLSGITFTLPTPPPRTAVVVGRVLDPSGAPVEGATVRLGGYCCIMYEAPTPAPAPTPVDASSSANASSGGSGVASTSYAKPIMPPYYGGDDQSAVTGPDGAFKLAGYAGPHTLSAEAKGFAQTSTRIDLAENQTLTQDLSLEKVPAADAKLDGKVVDAKTGLPVEGAQVYLYNAQWGRSNWTTTDATGAFHALTLPGWTQVNVAADANRGIAVPMAEGADVKAVAPPTSAPGVSYYAYEHVVTLASGANALEVKLDPKPAPDVVLTGYVVDPVAKAGVPNAWVNVWNQDAGEWGNAQTDATGSYKILVRAGHYTINAYADGYLGSQETFLIAQGEGQHRMDVQVLKGQTRYAPCDDCYPGPVMYDRASGVASSAPAAPAGAKTETVAAGATAGNAAAAAPPAPTGVQAYSGSGGGLPPYHAEAAGAQTEKPGDSAPAKSVPLPGVALVLGALGLLALASRRRR